MLGKNNKSGIEWSNHEVRKKYAREYATKQRIENREHINNLQRKNWRKRHPPKENVINWKDPVAKKEYRRKRMANRRANFTPEEREIHLEKKRICANNWRYKNREEYLRRSRARLKNDPEKVRKNSRDWYRKNNAKLKTPEARAQARKLSVKFRKTIIIVNGVKFNLNTVHEELKPYIKYLIELRDMKNKIKEMFNEQ